MADIREEAGLDIGATLAKAVVVAAGAPVDVPGTVETFMCPSADLSLLSTFLGRHPNASLTASLTLRSSTNWPRTHSPPMNQSSSSAKWRRR